MSKLESDLQQLKAKGKQHGDELHLFTCPFCNVTHPKNPALSVNTKLLVFYAHCCNQSGHVSKLLKKMYGGG